MLITSMSSMDIIDDDQVGWAKIVLALPKDLARCGHVVETAGGDGSVSCVTGCRVRQAFTARPGRCITKQDALSLSGQADDVWTTVVLSVPVAGPAECTRRTVGFSSWLRVVVGQFRKSAPASGREES